jgi:hypothetical protein
MYNKIKLSIPILLYFFTYKQHTVLQKQTLRPRAKENEKKKKGKLKLLSTLLSISTNHNGYDSLLKWATFSFAVF